MANTSARIVVKRSLRVAGRLGVVAMVLLVITLIAIQFARVIAQNVAMAHQLSVINGDIAALARRRAAQERELRRLEDPQGAIPDIHERLRLVRPNEAIVLLRPGPSQKP
jgi:cell division protein FtsB